MQKMINISLFLIHYLVQLFVFENKGRDRDSPPFLCFLDFEAKMSKIDMSENGHIFNCNNCVTGGPVRLCFTFRTIFYKHNFL